MDKQFIAICEQKIVNSREKMEQMAKLSFAMLYQGFTPDITPLSKEAACYAGYWLSLIQSFSEQNLFSSVLILLEKKCNNKNKNISSYDALAQKWQVETCHPIQLLHHIEMLQKEMNYVR